MQLLPVKATQWLNNAWSWTWSLLYCCRCRTTIRRTESQASGLVSLRWMLMTGRQIRCTQLYCVLLEFRCCGITIGRMDCQHLGLIGLHCLVMVGCCEGFLQLQHELSQHYIIWLQLLLQCYFSSDPAIFFTQEVNCMIQRHAHHSLHSELMVLLFTRIEIVLT